MNRRPVFPHGPPTHGGPLVRQRHLAVPRHRGAQPLDGGADAGERRGGGRGPGGLLHPLQPVLPHPGDVRGTGRPAARDHHVLPEQRRHHHRGTLRPAPAPAAVRGDGQRLHRADHLDRPPAGPRVPRRPRPHLRPLDRPAHGDRQARRHVPAPGGRRLRPRPRPVRRVRPGPGHPGRGGLQPQQPRRRLPAQAGAGAVHGRDGRPGPRGDRRVLPGVRRRGGRTQRGPGGDAAPQRRRAAQPRQELRAARRPLRLPRGQPGARGTGADHAAQVEPQLLRGARGLHAARPRPRVRAEPAPGAAGPPGDDRVAVRAARPDRLPLPGQLPLRPPPRGRRGHRRAGPHAHRAPDPGP